MLKAQLSAETHIKDLRSTLASIVARDNVAPAYANVLGRCEPRATLKYCATSFEEDLDDVARVWARGSPLGAQSESDSATP